VRFRLPDGGDGGDVYITMENWGMGIMVYRFIGAGVRNIIQIFTPTPTEDWNCVLRGMVFIQREEGEERPPHEVK
jgi:hypothetical protein